MSLFATSQKNSFTATKKKRKPKNPEWIARVSSIPKAILIEDLVIGFLPLKESECFAKTAWESYYEYHPDY